MPVGTRRPRRTAIRSIAAAAGLMLLVPASASAWEPDYEAPFRCGQNWVGGTRSDHSPSVYSVDFNRDDDYRAPVLASAAGLVTDVVNTGNTSYGRYVVVDHGRGHTSLYAHLDAQWVSEGQWVDQGAYIGLLGTSGGSTGPHLHFEERVNRVDRHAKFHNVRLNYDSTINSFNCGDVPLSGDWNGNERTDVGVWRPKASGGVFRLRRPGGSARVFRLGRATDRPITGDWDGDKVTDVGVWRPQQRKFVLRWPGGDVRSVRLGSRRDVPLTGDWDGNGYTDVGTYSPRKHIVRTWSASGSVHRIRFGPAAAVPLTGDFNGDGRTDLAAFNVRTSTWTLRLAGSGRIRTESFGRRGALPITGDWNGDGADSLGVWRPGRAVFAKQTDGTAARVQFGAERD